MHALSARRPPRAGQRRARGSRLWRSGRAGRGLRVARGSSGARRAKGVRTPVDLAAEEGEAVPALPDVGRRQRRGSSSARGEAQARRGCRVGSRAVGLRERLRASPRPCPRREWSLHGGCLLWWIDGRAPSWPRPSFPSIEPWSARGSCPVVVRARLRRGAVLFGSSRCSGGGCGRLVRRPRCSRR